MKGILRSEKSAVNRADQTTIDEYTKFFDQASASDRSQGYTTVVNRYYDLATDFYEFGWGHSFHFAPRHNFENHESSIARHEMWLAHKMRMTEGQRIMDIGCGVGGPLRCIAKFSQAHITGLNNNEYQISRGKRHAKNSGIENLCDFVKGDFMHIPSNNASYDGAYQIEATCHAPDRVGVYSEIIRILKPGSYFGGFEWVMTELYDPNNPEHEALKKGIERGNGIPDLKPISHVLDAMRKAGFEIVEDKDLSVEGHIPWYYPLTGRFTPSGLMHTQVGYWASRNGLWLMETARIAPKGAYGTLHMLQQGAVALVESGRRGIFSPMWFVLARKPQKAK